MLGLTKSRVRNMEALGPLEYKLIEIITRSMPRACFYFSFVDLSLFIFQSDLSTPFRHYLFSGLSDKQGKYLKLGKMERVTISLLFMGALEGGDYVYTGPSLNYIFQCSISALWIETRECAFAVRILSFINRKGDVCTLTFSCRIIIGELEIKVI